MKIEDVKVGMKVVPHSKTGGCSFEAWKTSFTTTFDFLKKNGYLEVYSAKENDIWIDTPGGTSGAHFEHSDLEPYIEQKKQKFGGYIQGNKTVVYIGSAKGEANYNPADAKQGLPYNKAYGIALAACRAEGVNTAWLDKAIEAEKTDFLPEAARLWNSGEKVKAIRLYSEGTGGSLIEAKHAVETFIDKQVEHHTVIIDGVKYVKEG